MLSGLEKAQIVLSILGENSSKILERLSEGSRRKITAVLGETAETDPQTRSMILSELLNKIDSSKSNRPSGLSNSFQQNTLSSSNPFAESALYPQITKAPPQLATPQEGDLELGQPTPAPVNPNTRFTAEEAGRISERLQREKGQIIAFFMNQLNEDERALMSDYLPSSITSQLEESKIDKIPLAGKVFANLLKKLSQPEDEISGSSGGRSNSSTSSKISDKEEIFRF